jgi:hypothetical protein
MCAQIAPETPGAGLNPTQTKTLEGSLRSFNLFEVLQFLRLGAMTGVLSISRDDDEIRLMVRQGKIINSSIFTHRQRLGELLMMRGILSRRELDEILSGQRVGAIQNPIGQVLLERKIIDQETLEQTLRLQLEEEIWSVLNWEDGEFRFDPMTAVVENAPILFELEIEPLILEESRRQDEWKLISQIIAHDELIPVPVPPEEYHERDPSLTANEWRLLAMLSGNLTVGALVERSGLGRFETYRILANYVRQNWIKCIQPGPDSKGLAESIPDRGQLVTQSDADQRGRNPLLLWKRPPRAPAEITPNVGKSHRTLIGLEAAVANELMLAIRHHCEDDKSGLWPLTSLSWQYWTSHYPTADGVAIRGGLLDASLFEDLWCPLQNPMLRTQLAEDTWGAVGELIVHAVDTLREKMPARECEKFFAQLLADLETAEIGEDLPAGLTVKDLAALLEQKPDEEDSHNGW